MQPQVNIAKAPLNGKCHHIALQLGFFLPRAQVAKTTFFNHAFQPVHKCSIPICAQQYTANTIVFVQITEQRPQSFRGGIFFQPRQDIIHQKLQRVDLFPLHMVHQVINIGIMEIESSPADVSQFGQLPHGDFPHRFLHQQRDQCIGQALAGQPHAAVLLTLAVHKRMFPFRQHPHHAFLRWPGNCLVNILIVKPHGLFVKEKLHFCIDLYPKRIMFLCAVYDFAAFCGLRRCAHGFVL